MCDGEQSLYLSPLTIINTRKERPSPFHFLRPRCMAISSSEVQSCILQVYLLDASLPLAILLHPLMKGPNLSPLLFHTAKRNRAMRSPVLDRPAIATTDCQGSPSASSKTAFHEFVKRSAVKIKYFPLRSSYPIGHVHSLIFAVVFISRLRDIGQRPEAMYGRRHNGIRSLNTLPDDLVQSMHWSTINR